MAKFKYLKTTAQYWNHIRDEKRRKLNSAIHTLYFSYLIPLQKSENSIKILPFFYVDVELGPDYAGSRSRSCSILFVSVRVNGFTSPSQRSAFSRGLELEGRVRCRRDSRLYTPTNKHNFPERT